MTILVTGGAGYIGSHMVHALVDAGEQVIVIDNLSTGFEWALPKGVPLVIGNVGDQSLLQPLFSEHEVETIIHFAASTVVSESVAKPLEYYRNNTVNSRSLIELAINGRVRNFIFSSTCAVYGSSPSVIVREDCQPAPMSPYASSKLMSEIMLRDASAVSGLKHIILRYFNVAGADPLGRTGQSTKNATTLIKAAVEAAVGRRPKMEIYGTDYNTADGTAVRDYIHVSDLVAAHFDALRYLRGGGSSMTLNCGYARGHSVLDVIETVKRISGVDFAVTLRGRRAGDLPAIVADAGLIRSVLGWRPQFDDLDTIVRHALAWERRSAQRQA
jgi:UDP-glucose 4-epimerase